MKYKIINWLLLFLSIAFVGNIIRNIATLSREDNIMKEVADKLLKVSDENQSLKRQLAQVESRDFIEKEARNKLNLGKDGEVVIILPSISPFITPTPQPPDNSPNWQKWIRLFL